MRETATSVDGIGAPRTGPSGVRRVMQSDIDCVDLKLRHVRRRRAKLREIDDPRQRRRAEIELDQEEDALKGQLDGLRKARALFV